MAIDILEKRFGKTQEVIDVLYNNQLVHIPSAISCQQHM